jgi:hypothetical protein
MNAPATLALVMVALCFFPGFSSAQEVMNMRSIQEMCGPKWGHKELVDQAECVLRVVPQSNNPDLMPSDPYIGWYTQMALKMIDDLRNNKISEGDAKENIQQAYHEVLIRQQQAANDHAEQETMERRRVRLARQQEQAEANARQSVIDDRNAAIVQARADQFCASAAPSVEETCAVQTRNPQRWQSPCVRPREFYMPSRDADDHQHQNKC